MCSSMPLNEGGSKGELIGGLMAHKRLKKGKKKGGKFIQAATARMKAKGTLGAFGKATEGKISRAKAKGGLAKKRAVFAENMKRIARKRKGKKARKY